MAEKPFTTHAQLKQAAADKLVQEESAKPKPFYTPEQLKRANEKVSIVQVISGTTEKGEAFYAYVNVHLGMYEEFIQKMTDGESMNVEKYGKVLKKGFGQEPSDDVKRYMEETFGVDHNFIEHVTEELEKLQKNRK